MLLSRRKFLAACFFKEHQKYFKFIYKGDLYKFLCLHNGFVHGPRLFTKILKVLVACLLRLCYVLANYDGFINFGDDFKECIDNTADTMQMLTDLGFTIHPEKSKTYSITRDDIFRIYNKF